MSDPSKIRNFAIIAHIDHGKSTLTDRMLELTGTRRREDADKERITDTLELEQEKGITIKLQPATMQWKGYTLNLIDTPGHIDFTYEVSRSLKACEGAILLIDASQGIQAQTIANVYLAFEHNLTLIPVLNKIDLPHVDRDQRLIEIEEVLGFKSADVVLASGKSGEGVEDILQAIVDRLPPPATSTTEPLQALIFDSFYDNHQGVIAAVRVFNQSLDTRKRVTLKSNGVTFTPLEVGVFTPRRQPTAVLEAGHVGYIATGIKEIREVTIGDTIVNNASTPAIAGYHKPEPTVFATVFPLEREEFPNLKTSLEKLALNDAALSITPEQSVTMGQGFRCGFLGPLHLEVTKQRLSREYDTETLFSIPNVSYQATLMGDRVVDIFTADHYPNPSTVQEIREPWISMEILAPFSYQSAIIEIIRVHRGIFLQANPIAMAHVQGMNYVQMKFELPFSELLKNIFSQLKSSSHGYASFTYTFIDYRSVDLVKVDVLVNKDPVSSLSFLETRDQARSRAIEVLQVLKESIHRHLFAIPLQAAINGTIIAREDIAAARKNVTGYLYGGDVSRKKKLLQKQKKGKKLMQQVGKVNIPSDIFIKIMNRE